MRSKPGRLVLELLPPDSCQQQQQGGSPYAAAAPAAEEVVRSVADVAAVLPHGLRGWAVAKVRCCSTSSGLLPAASLPCVAATRALSACSGLPPDCLPVHLACLPGLSVQTFYGYGQHLFSGWVDSIDPGADLFHIRWGSLCASCCQLSACSAPSACWTVPPRQQPPAYWLLSALSGAAAHAPSKSRCATRSSAAQHIRMAAGLTLSLPVLPLLLPPRPAPVPVPAAAAMRMGMGRMLSWKSCCPF